VTPTKKRQHEKRKVIHAHGQTGIPPVSSSIAGLPFFRSPNLFLQASRQPVEQHLHAFFSRRCIEFQVRMGRAGAKSIALALDIQLKKEILRMIDPQLRPPVGVQQIVRSCVELDPLEE
jgi:hypothetical protein